MWSIKKKRKYCKLNLVVNLQASNSKGESEAMSEVSKAYANEGPLLLLERTRVGCLRGDQRMFVLDLCICGCVVYRVCVSLSVLGSVRKLQTYTNSIS